VTADEKRSRIRRHARIRRVKQLLKWMPRRSNLDRYPVLKWFAKAARKRPYLWSFKVPSCTPAFYFGSLIAFMPLMGVQILLAFVAAIFLRANLPIMVGLQGISNPLTIPFLYPLYFIMGRRTMEFLGMGLELNPIVGGMHATFLGGAIVGLAAGVTLDLFYRFMVFEARKHSLRRAPRLRPDVLDPSPPLPEPARQDLEQTQETESDRIVR
jgi:uncharacterized protein